jgi:thiamine biosynthesis lipoprotein
MEFVYSTRNPSVPTAYSRLEAMHTSCEMLLPFLPEADARALAEDVWSMVEEADRRYNRFSAGSMLAEVNRKAAGEAVAVDEELFMALELCETFRKATGGYFDVSAGSRMTERSLELDAAAHTVRFSRPGMRLDLGGFAKGFVLEKAMKAVKAQASSALLSFGGSSVAAVGRHPLGAPWPVSVAHSYYPDRTAHAFPLEDAALSVSGKDPRGRGHIIDPLTGNTVEKEGLVAVTGPSAMVAEVLSTALWVAPAPKRGAILAAFDGYRAWEILCRTDGQALTMTI